MKQKRFFTDLLYGAAGLVAMNAVLSLLVYPMLERRLGIGMQGRVLFFMSLANLFAGTFGSGANYGRMKVYAKERKTVNGESNLFLLSAAVLARPRRIVIKRPAKGPYLSGRKPDFSLPGKAVRYDVILLHS